MLNKLQEVAEKMGLATSNDFSEFVRINNTNNISTNEKDLFRFSSWLWMSIVTPFISGNIATMSVPFLSPAARLPWKWSNFNSPGFFSISIYFLGLIIGGFTI